LPIIETITKREPHVQAIVLAPTRELAIQVAEEMQSLQGDQGILRVLPVYGGQSMSLQLRALRNGVDVIVGTPGRVIDHLNKKSLKIDKIRYFVLDEADEMLNMGFIDDIKEIFTFANPERQTLLFSATMPAEIMHVAKKYMKDHIVVSVKKTELTTTNVEQIYFQVRESDKFEALSRIIDIEEDFYGIIFCKTKVDTDNVASHLNKRGYDAVAIHGDIEQKQRERILK
jgi:ATP-dependent RNA helicase DeaD